MSHIKRYLLLAFLAGIACVARFGDLFQDYEMVDTFRGAALLEEDWNPLIAQTVNDKKISVSIDSREYASDSTDIYMDDNRNIMVPVDILSEGLNCSAHLYDRRALLVEKRTDEVLLTLNDTQMSVNQKPVEITTPMIERNGTYYVSLGEVSESLGYQFDWNMDKNRATAVDSAQTASVFPARYDLREKGRVGRIKDQKNTGTCWAFAALSAMESDLLPEESEEFSPDHMTLSNSFDITEISGGEYTMGMAYLLSWQGPVLEKDDPFGDGKTTSGLTAVKHVQEVQMMEGKDYEKIKEAVFRHGGVQTALYSSMPAGTEDSSFYNRRNSSYCYIGTQKPNHEVVIIGWDDNYPKENFTVNVEGDGAFICQNSWGEGFGEDGIFYVSYYDTNIGSHNLVYTGIEDTDNYDHIYQSDLCGWVGQIGFEKEEVFGANVYQTREAEQLAAVGFYATGKDTSYKIYLVRNFNGQDSLADRVKIAQGKLKNAGYYTIPIEDTIELDAGESYAVMLYVDTPGAVHPLAVEYAADAATADVDLSDGEGYISINGKNWEHVEDTSSCNLCIKAYTDNVGEKQP